MNRRTFLLSSAAVVTAGITAATAKTDGVPVPVVWGKRPAEILDLSEGPIMGVDIGSADASTVFFWANNKNLNIAELFTSNDGVHWTRTPC